MTITTLLDKPLTQSWVKHLQGAYYLAEQVQNDGWQPTAVLGLARGGAVPATVIAYTLDVKEMRTVQTTHYIGPMRRYEAGPQFIHEEEDLATLAESTHRLLIVDDIVDTGATIDLIMSKVKEYCDEVRVAALYIRPGQESRADWFWQISEEWINFPWENE